MILFYREKFHLKFPLIDVNHNDNVIGKKKILCLFSDSYYLIIFYFKV